MESTPHTNESEIDSFKTETVTMTHDEQLVHLDQSHGANVDGVSEANGEEVVSRNRKPRMRNSRILGSIGTDS